MTGMAQPLPMMIFEDIRLDTPNCSGRMDNLRAAILRPQLAQLETNIERWNERYRAIEKLPCEKPCNPRSRPPTK